MASPRGSTHHLGRAARTGVAGTIVAAVAFFDGVFVGLPVAVLAASLRPLVVFPVSAVVVTLLSVACCTWVDRRWDAWSPGNSGRIESRLAKMRASSLLRHPVAWIERGSDRWYAFAAAVANPILVAAFARSLGGKPVGERRILLGSVAYAIPYVALWTFVGLAVGDVVRAA